MDKRELRRLVRTKKQQFSAADLRTMSEKIISNLLAMPVMKKSCTVLMYYSLNDEVNTHDAIDRLVADGKTVLLPVVIGDNAMELRRYTGPGDLRVGSYGIKEPVGPLYSDYGEIDVAIVPGMGFDRNGNRLGRGKGYYDRFLPLLPQAEKIGICFPFQIFPTVPTDENDIRMDSVLA